MQNNKLAYCAGVIDSDGCIGMYKRPNQNGYRIRVSAAQVKQPAIKLLHELFDGAMFIKNRPSKNWRNLYWWEVTSRDAEKCLRKLLPYLRVKKPQAELCLQYYKIKTKLQPIISNGYKTLGLSKSTIKAMNALHDKMHKLNQTGVLHE